MLVAMDPTYVDSLRNFSVSVREAGDSRVAANSRITEIFRALIDRLFLKRTYKPS